MNFVALQKPVADRIYRAAVFAARTRQTAK